MKCFTQISQINTKSMIHFNLILICLNENGVNYLKPAGGN